MDGELLRVRDVAERLRLSQRTIFKLRATGELPAPVRIGRALRWRAADIAAWIAAGCTAPETGRTSKGGRT